MLNELSRWESGVKMEQTFRPSALRNSSCDECVGEPLNVGSSGRESHRKSRGRRYIGALFFTIYFLSLMIGRCESFSMAAEQEDDDDDMDELAHLHGFRLRRAVVEPLDSLKDAEQIVPANYSIHVPPPNQGNATLVLFSVIIMNVRDIKEINEELSLELNLRIFWKDTRLKHLGQTTGEKNKFVVLNPNLLSKIWHPDIFIDHVKTVNQPALISKPASLRFYSDSTVRYSGRWTVTMACQMDFHYYPADTQKCHVDMKSYAYTTKILDLRWHEQKGAFLADKLELPNFDVALDHTKNFTTETSSGHYSTIRFTILLRRKLSYHLIQTYLPSALFIIVSWLSFLIPPESVPGRMACCMTTLLTLTAMFAAVRQNTPNVSYVKALDIWMVVCIIFVFLTLVEYTVVLKLKSLKPKKKEEKKQQQQPPQQQTEAMDANTLTALRPGSAPNNGHNGSTHSLSSILYPPYMDNPALQMRRSATKETAFMAHPGPHGDRVHTNPSSLPPLPLSSMPKSQSPVPSKPPNPFDFYAKKLEKFTSTLIPILFIVFNFIYWPWLIQKAEYNHHQGAPGTI